MKRVAFTIIYNGAHHLMHNNYATVMSKNFDYWVLVEGAALPTGSTSWCKDIFTNSESTDDTIKLINDICTEHSNVQYIQRINGNAWENKDKQVNAAIDALNVWRTENNVDSCYLWQIDIDEQWTIDQLEQAEKELSSGNGKTGCFLCNYFVGPNLVVKGQWGEGQSGPYRRLWRWEGEKFETHEPPVLNGKNGPGLLLTPRFNHYAYFFEKDVTFKEQYYGYTSLVSNWKNLQTTPIPQTGTHISALLDARTNHWGNTNTWILKYEQ
jgi:hypothetical protein